MSPIEFLRKVLMHYFIIVTLVTLVIAILGMVYEPNQQFGYEAYFSPLIFGLLGVVPSIATYSKKELTVKQMIVRKGIQLILIEIMIIAFSTMMGILKSEMIGSMVFSIFIIFIIVHIIEWLIGNKKAHELTLELKAFQKEMKEQRNI